MLQALEGNWPALVSAGVIMMIGIIGMTTIQAPYARHNAVGVVMAVLLAIFWKFSIHPNVREYAHTCLMITGMLGGMHVVRRVFLHAVRRVFRALR